MNERDESFSGLSEIFSRNMKVGAIGAIPVQRRIDADAPERTALAQLFGLQAISSLTGNFTLACTGSAGGTIEATLVLGARVTQTCVVSLEPFEAKIAETVKLRFVPAANLRDDSEPDLDPESLEDPDELPYAADIIDLGASLAEQLALALDPYPRKPGAELSPAAGGAVANPFAVLAARKNLPANDPE